MSADIHFIVLWFLVFGQVIGVVAGLYLAGIPSSMLNVRCWTFQIRPHPKKEVALITVCLLKIVAPARLRLRAKCNNVLIISPIFIH